MTLFDFFEKVGTMTTCGFTSMDEAFEVEADNNCGRVEKFMVIALGPAPARHVYALAVHRFYPGASYRFAILKRKLPQVIDLDGSNFLSGWTLVQDAFYHLWIRTFLGANAPLILNMGIRLGIKLGMKKSH